MTIARHVDFVVVVARLFAAPRFDHDSIILAVLHELLALHLAAQLQRPFTEHPIYSFLARVEHRAAAAAELVAVLEKVHQIFRGEILVLLRI